MCALWELYLKSGGLTPDLRSTYFPSVGQWLKQQPSGWVELWLEGQFLHKEIDSGVDLKAVKVVGVTLQPHE